MVMNKKKKKSTMDGFNDTVSFVKVEISKGEDFDSFDNKKQETSSKMMDFD